MLIHGTRCMGNIHAIGDGGTAVGDGTAANPPFLPWKFPVSLQEIIPFSNITQKAKLHFPGSFVAGLYFFGPGWITLISQLQPVWGGDKKTHTPIREKEKKKERKKEKAYDFLLACKTMTPTQEKGSTG